MNLRLILFLLPLAAAAQTTKPDVLKRMDETKSAYEDLALKIWSFAEVG